MLLQESSPASSAGKIFLTKVQKWCKTQVFVRIPHLEARTRTENPAHKARVPLPIRRPLLGGVEVDAELIALRNYRKRSENCKNKKTNKKNQSYQAF